MFKDLIAKWACGHDWDIHYTSNTYDVDAFTGVRTQLPVKSIRTLICKKCGKIKRIKL